MISSILLLFLFLVNHVTCHPISSNDAATTFLQMIAKARETRTTIPMIGVHDTLSARIVQQHNSSNKIALFVSGFGVSASRLGEPDAGILTRSDMEDACRNVILSVPRPTPVIMDGDTGYGGASNIRQTIRRAAAMGAAAISIEDQVFPKRCTYVAGTNVNVVDRKDAVDRVRTAIAAQKEAYEQDGNKILLIARTDCRLGWNLQEAIERCQVFEELGADLVYAENLQSDDEYVRVRNLISKPMILAQVQTGRNEKQLKTMQEIGGMGFEVALWGVMGLQAAVAAMSHAVSELLGETGRVASTELATLESVKRVVGFDSLDEFEAQHRCT